MTIDDQELIERAVAWHERDRDDVTREQLTGLITRAQAGDSSALAELRDAFAGPLAFGTAGLRGRMGPGSNRMNRVTVTHAAAGVAAYVNGHGGGSVVIGYDARHGSEDFAHITAQVMSGAGVEALLLPEPLPTPVLAFAVKHLGCTAGIMVTASHNPAQDNGYKVYLSDGRQLISPADIEIAELIATASALPSLDDIPLGHDWSTAEHSVVDAYLARAVSLLEEEATASITIAYTPMHGVGGATFSRLMSLAGFGSLVPVASQFEPDPDFPTVAYPNPEEPGAMDLALATAADANASILIAHDPDADRCAVGLPGPDGWRMLTGDELGWLLAWWIGAGNRRLSRKGVFAQSIVSGTMLEGIAKDYGLDYAQTLTGFKWISRVPDLMFGYEEALGYCVDPLAVPDKDGMTAALMAAELTLRLEAQGTSPQGILDSLARKHGFHATGQVSARFDHVSEAIDSMARLRTAPPTTAAGIDVASIDDLLVPSAGLPATDGLRITLVDNSRIIIRPSGTEPKLKCYLQVVEEVADDIQTARTTAHRRMDALAQATREWVLG